MKKFEDPLIARIDGYTAKGDGAAKVDKKYPFDVIGALEGERASLKILKRSGRSFVASVVEILEQSPHRIKPLCQHAPLCGGCRLQHLRYEEQLKIKEQHLSSLFKGIKSRPIIACDDPFYMRNKMEFSFGEGKLGLIEAGSRGRVLDLQECHICPPAFMGVLKSVRAWSLGIAPFNPRNGEGVLRSLTIRSSLQGDLQIVLTVMEMLSLEQIESLKEAVPTGSLFINIHHAKKGVKTWFELILLRGEKRLVEDFGSFKLAVSPTSFLQPNPSQAKKIYQAAVDFLSLKGDEVVLDLYAGVGAFGLALSPFVKKVISVEVTQDALEDAKVSMGLSLASNIEFVESDVAPWIDSYTGSADIVIVDPPRSGLDPLLIRKLLELKAETIVYISCNIETQSRDLNSLLEGYEAVEMQAVDQFPHTLHLENILLLKKRPNVL